MGPGLVGLFSREALPASGRPVTEANILRQLNDPMGSMPTFAWMEEWEKDAVVAYLKTL